MRYRSGIAPRQFEHGMELLDAQGMIAACIPATARLPLHGQLGFQAFEIADIEATASTRPLRL